MEEIAFLDSWNVEPRPEVAEMEDTEMERVSVLSGHCVEDTVCVCVCVERVFLLPRPVGSLVLTVPSLFFGDDRDTNMLDHVRWLFLFLPEH